MRIFNGHSMGCSCRTRLEVKDLVAVFLYVVLLFGTALSSVLSSAVMIAAHIR